MMFRLGDRVVITAMVCPTKKYKGFGRIEKRWERMKLDHPATGVIAGVRYVQDGFSQYQGEEVGWVFEPERFNRVYLVAVNMKQLIRVLPEDIQQRG